MLEAPHEPCWRCQVRADVGCAHRPASGPPPAKVPVRVDGRVLAAKMNPWGKHGNPAGPAAKRILEHMKNHPSLRIAPK